MFKVASQQAPKDEQDSSIASALYQMGKTAVLSDAYLGEGAKALNMYLSLEKGQKWNNLPTKGGGRVFDWPKSWPNKATSRKH